MSHKTHTYEAHAKTNLWLRVTGQREDGFHNIESRMVLLSLADKIELQLIGRDKISLTCSDESLPTGEKNLVVRAVRAMEKHTGQDIGAKIHLEKNIPVGAGLGGGSSDAAAVIKAINELKEFGIDTQELARIGASIGSDVPFFLYNQTCDVSGRGEEVTPVAEEEILRLPVVLLKPGFQISAAWAYQNLAKSQEVHVSDSVPQLCPWGKMENDLERPVFMKFPVLRQMKTWLLAQPEVHGALLSGSGSTVVAVLRHFDGGEPLVKRAKARFGEPTWTYCGYTV
ncbi:MAG: 4-(cytidine 5'-diphospho)-2-C-methyl-D-erythritol kinase [Verrucomicrobiales bacterium]|nr:4-(cytidine 5'-diphospho)-2-C-methyl-D-erythritol kinase [Verrucomicrobiales bacterium]